MSVNLTTQKPTSCFDFDHNVFKYCFDPKRVCFPQVLEGLLVECGEDWNCNLISPSDVVFNNVLPEDGVFDIQLNFYDPNGGTATPTMAWDGGWLTAQLSDQTNTVYDLTDFATEYVNGWSGDHYYQTIRIDVSLMPASVTCFDMRFSTTDTQDDVCTQAFEIDRGGCEKWVKLSSSHTKYDCWKNYYGATESTFVGTSDFQYDNGIYLKAQGKYAGGEISVDVQQQELYGVSGTEYFRILPEEKYPEYLVKYIFNKVLTGNTFYATTSDGKYVNDEYENRGTGRVTPIDSSHMYLPVIELSRDDCNSQDLGGNC